MKNKQTKRPMIGDKVLVNGRPGRIVGMEMVPVVRFETGTGAFLCTENYTWNIGDTDNPRRNKKA